MESLISDYVGINHLDHSNHTLITHIPNKLFLSMRWFVTVTTG